MPAPETVSTDAFDVDQDRPASLTPLPNLSATRAGNPHSPPSSTFPVAASLVTRVDYRIALDRTLRGRPTLRTSEGWLARRVWLRTGVEAGGAWTVAVANLTGEAQTLRLRGDTPADPMRDVLSGATIPAPRSAISMNPWQIRILRTAPPSP